MFCIVPEGSWLHTKKGNKEVTYYNISAWGKTGEACKTYLHKGNKVSVVGPLKVRPYTNKAGQAGVSLEVSADHVEFLTAPTQAAAAPAAPAGFTAVEGDEMPF